MKRVVLILMLLGGCSEQQRWHGLINPGHNDRRTTFITQNFDTLQECQAYSRAMLSSVRGLQSGDFRCVSNCRTLSPWLAQLLGKADGKLCFGATPLPGTGGAPNGRNV